MVIDDALGGEGIGRPGAGKKLIAAQHAAPRVHKQAQQLELERGQIHKAAIFADLAAVEIDFDVSEAATAGLRLGTGAAKQGFDSGAELVHAERLGDVIVGAEFQTHHLFGFLRLGGEHENRRAAAAAAEIAADFKSILAGQHDVEHDQIELVLLGAAEGVGAVGGDLDLIAFHLEIVFEAQRDGGFVFSDQDAGHARLPRAGSNMVNSLPCPGSLATTICPPCAATMWRTIARPSPDPLALAAFAALPRTKRRKMAFRSTAGMPSPLSRTRIAIQESRSSHSTQTVG